MISWVGTLLFANRLFLVSDFEHVVGIIPQSRPIIHVRGLQLSVGAAFRPLQVGAQVLYCEKFVTSFVMAHFVSLNLNTRSRKELKIRSALSNLIEHRFAAFVILQTILGCATLGIEHFICYNPVDVNPQDLRL